MLRVRNVTRFKCALQLRLGVVVDEWELQRDAVIQTLTRHLGVLTELAVAPGSLIITVTAWLNVTSAGAFVAADGYEALRVDIGLGASIESPLQVLEETTFQVPYDTGCSKGFYCSAAQEYACPQDTWNNLTDQVSTKACIPCPATSGTRDVGSTSADDCLCEPSYYKGLSGDCATCPSGTDCEMAGVRLDNLPIRPGYFRRANTSIDVRRCPDAESKNYSGCSGGSAVDHLCKPGLKGICKPACPRSCPLTHASWSHVEYALCGSLSGVRRAGPLLRLCEECRGRTL